MASKYRWDDFVLDQDAYRLERGGVPLALEPKAFNLLVLLIGRPGHVFSKQEIFEAVWPETAVTDHALTRVVAQLRRVLGDEARDAKYIETVPTRGYRWLPTVELVDTPPISAAVFTPSDAATSIPDPDRRYRRAVRPGVAFGVAVTVALFAVVAWSQRGDSEGVTTPHIGAWPVQLTTNPGLDLHPAFSPHGDAIAYASDRAGTFQIYVRSLATSASEVAITGAGENSVQPAWSPDGRFIAFHSLTRGGIWVIPSRGGVPRQVASEGSQPAWSPDGRAIAFTSDEDVDSMMPMGFSATSGATVRAVDADGSNLRQLTQPGHPLGGHGAPAWSRDGRWVAFSVFEGGTTGSGIWLTSLMTGEVQRILQEVRGFYELVFAPDDSALYVAGGDAYIRRLAFDKTDGSTGESTFIPVPGVASVRSMSITADGTQLAFTNATLTSQIWAQPITPDGTARDAPRAVTTDANRRNSLPAMSPDGSRVAYMSIRGGDEPHVSVVDIDGRNGRQISTIDEGANTHAFWSADGRRLAFLTKMPGALQLYAADLETGRTELIFDGAKVIAPLVERHGGAPVDIAVSPSFQHVALALVRPPRANRQLFVAPLGSAEWRDISDASRSVGYPAWSRDERRLAVEIKDGGSVHAGVLDVETGTLRQLTNEAGQTWVRSWSPDGTKIVAAAARAGLWDVRWIDATTGASRIITPNAAPNIYYRYPEWSARGDLIVFERGEVRGNIWTLPISH